MVHKEIKSEHNGYALSRRSFLRLGAAGAVMTAADWSLWAADEGLPAYYGEHLAKVATRLRALSEKCDDAFFFITDLHIPSNRCVSGRVLAKLVAETNVKKVLCGGDLRKPIDASAPRLTCYMRTLHAEWIISV